MPGFDAEGAAPPSVNPLALRTLTATPPPRDTIPASRSKGDTATCCWFLARASPLAMAILNLGVNGSIACHLSAEHCLCDPRLAYRTAKSRFRLPPKVACSEARLIFLELVQEQSPRFGRNPDILKPGLLRVAEVGPSRMRNRQAQERIMARWRLECVELAPALVRPSQTESDGKAMRLPSSERTNSL